MGCAHDHCHDSSYFHDLVFNTGCRLICLYMTIPSVASDLYSFILIITGCSFFLFFFFVIILHISKDTIIAFLLTCTW